MLASPGVAWHRSGAVVSGRQCTCTHSKHAGNVRRSNRRLPSPGGDSCAPLQATVTAKGRPEGNVEGKDRFKSPFELLVRGIARGVLILFVACGGMLAASGAALAASSSLSPAPSFQQALSGAVAAAVAALRSFSIPPSALSAAVYTPFGQLLGSAVFFSLCCFILWIAATSSTELASAAPQVALRAQLAPALATAAAVSAASKGGPLSTSPTPLPRTTEAPATSPPAHLRSIDDELYTPPEGSTPATTARLSMLFKDSSLPASSEPTDWWPAQYPQLGESEPYSQSPTTAAAESPEATIATGSAVQSGPQASAVAASTESLGTLPQVSSQEMADWTAGPVATAARERNTGLLHSLGSSLAVSWKHTRTGASGVSSERLEGTWNSHSPAMSPRALNAAISGVQPKEGVWSNVQQRYGAWVGGGAQSDSARAPPSSTDNSITTAEPVAGTEHLAVAETPAAAATTIAPPGTSGGEPVRSRNVIAATTAAGGRLLETSDGDIVPIGKTGKALASFAANLAGPFLPMINDGHKPLVLSAPKVRSKADPLSSLSSISRDTSSPAWDPISSLPSIERPTGGAAWDPLQRLSSIERPTATDDWDPFHALARATAPSGGDDWDPVCALTSADAPSGLSTLDPVYALRTAEAPRHGASWDPLKAMVRSEAPEGGSNFDPMHAVKGAEAPRGGSSWDPIKAAVRAEMPRGGNMFDPIHAFTHIEVPKIPRLAPQGKQEGDTSRPAFLFGRRENISPTPLEPSSLPQYRPVAPPVMSVSNADGLPRPQSLSGAPRVADDNSSIGEAIFQWMPWGADRKKA